MTHDCTCSRRNLIGRRGLKVDMATMTLVVLELRALCCHIVGKVTEKISSRFNGSSRSGGRENVHVLTMTMSPRA